MLFYMERICKQWFHSYEIPSRQWVVLAEFSVRATFSAAQSIFALTCESDCGSVEQKGIKSNFKSPPHPHHWLEPRTTLGRGAACATGWAKVVPGKVSVSTKSRIPSKTAVQDWPLTNFYSSNETQYFTLLRFYRYPKGGGGSQNLCKRTAFCVNDDLLFSFISW